MLTSGSNDYASGKILEARKDPNLTKHFTAGGGEGEAAL